jgi:hypothetical protein
MADTEERSIDQLLDKTGKALEANYFHVSLFSDKESLIGKIAGFVRAPFVIGFGGSLTVRELGLVERLRGDGITLLDHWKEGLTKEEISEIRIKQMTSDLFLTSANAITENGEIANIDGVGNRINSMTFGPKKVIIVAGYNKIVPDMNAALERIRNIAAPANARRLGLALPCAKTGKCQDCTSELRICRVISIIQRKPVATDISVFLLNQVLGY